MLTFLWSNKQIILKSVIFCRVRADQCLLLTSHAMCWSYHCECAHVHTEDLHKMYTCWYFTLWMCDTDTKREKDGGNDWAIFFVCSLIKKDVVFLRKQLSCSAEWALSYTVLTGSREATLYWPVIRNSSPLLPIFSFN